MHVCTDHELKPAGSTAPLPVVASAFNKINGGNILAYAVGYDWSHGYKGATPNQPNKIMLHSIKVGTLRTQQTYLHGAHVDLSFLFCRRKR